MADHIVCTCHAYAKAAKPRGFPHQIGKGKCDGRFWLREFHDFHAGHREYCKPCRNHAEAGPIDACHCKLSTFKKPTLTDCPALVAEADKKGAKL